MKTTMNVKMTSLAKHLPLLKHQPEEELILGEKKKNKKEIIFKLCKMPNHESPKPVCQSKLECL
jgi:hypothetical protein